MARQVMIEAEETQVVSSSEALLRAKAKEAKENVDDNYVELSRVLYEIYHKKVFMNWGFISFQDYIDTELDFEYRKSMYLIDIWGHAKHLEISPERMKAIGWTKIREIVRVADTSNIEYWLTQAENLKCSELIALIKEYKSTGKVKSTLDLVNFSFKLDQADVTTVNLALDEAMRLVSTSSISKALVMICTEWVMEKNIVPLKVDMAKMLDYLEEAYGVKLTVAEKKKEDEDPFV